MAQNTNMLITAALAIVIVIAIGAYAYTNLFNPDQTPVDENNDMTPDKSGDQNIDNTDEINLTIEFLDTNYTFSISDLEKMKIETGSGRYIKTKLLPDSVVLGSIHNFTGIMVRTLFDELNITIDDYQINVTSSDGWTSTYTKNETLGQIDIYNETGVIISNETATMIIAYKEDESYYSEIDEGKEADDIIGPFRIAFIGDNTPITSSNIWSKMVTTIEIVNLS